VSSRAHSVDDYLETIYFLAFPVGEYGPVVRESPALAARVAEMLGVSAPSASEMLKRLEADGLIERGPRRATLLTPKGREVAERVVRHHRLIERFLTDFMGYTPAECHEQAELLGDAFTDEMVERMAERLGEPDRCPHGWPVDPAAEQRENEELIALSDVEPGDEATIVRLAEHDGELLSWFYREGYPPGTSIRLLRVERAAGQLLVEVDGGERAISERAAAGLFVRVLGKPATAG
jgi:DtxR family transcriptional regulator, Mn-dependent transcriptional regulator